MNFLLISVLVLFLALFIGLMISSAFHRVEDAQLEFDGGYEDPYTV